MVQTAMLQRSLLLLLVPLAACGQGKSEDDWGKRDRKREAFKVPVRLEKPGRSAVEDWVESQANLESDRRAMILAEVDGRVVERHRDLGDRVGDASYGDEPYLLARIDDRDPKLAVRVAEIKVKEERGRLRELEVDESRSERNLEQAKLEAEEAAAVLRRTTSGIRDGAITLEEHEKAQFAEKVAQAKVAAIAADLEKSKVAQTLGAVMLEDAEVDLERAQVALEKTRLIAPFEGVVSYRSVNVGERVRVGDHLFTIEDPSVLVLYAEIPVRQANKIRTGNPVRIVSNATPEGTTGKVLLVAPTVDSAAGTVRVKIGVDAKAGFRPGLFVTVRIVVQSRKNALVVPKRAVLHDDETGAYLYVVREGQAARTDVKTGYETPELIEIVEGIDETSDVVVEGQDTLGDGAAVEVLEG
ncbi:MAG: efflux RND transporter periplasmic adaptor subunit [Planctomycetota bacterium]